MAANTAAQTVKATQVPSWPAAPPESTATETIPVAMTSAKYPGDSWRTAARTRVSAGSRIAKPDGPIEIS